MSDGQPLLYDLFCGAGGACAGYQQAGFRVVGVDVLPQPRYPGEAFLQMDAFEFLLRYEAGQFERAAAMHASPPCQAYSVIRHLPWLRGKEYPRLIGPTLAHLRGLGLPFVIENVMGARREQGMAAGWLCGQMFGLPFFRHRLFATNWPWLAPGHPRHEGSVRNGRTLGSRERDIVALPEGAALRPDGYVNRQKKVELGLPRIVVRPENSRHVGMPALGLERWQMGNGAQGRGVGVGHAAGVHLAREAMGVSWMTREEVTQALPPVYTAFIGAALLQHLERGRAALR